MAVKEGEQEEKKQEGLTKEDVNKLVEERLKEIKGGGSHQDFVEAIKELKGEDVRDMKYVPEQYIDEDDLMDEPAVFFCYKSGYAIVDDIRNGHSVRTPFGNVIWFKYEASKKRQKGRETNHIHIAKYATRSQKEATWLRDHSMFGVIFFDRLGEASDELATKSALIAAYYDVYRNAKASELITYCQNMGIQPKDSPQTMRIALAQKRAEADLRDQKGRTQDQVETTAKEELIVGSSG